MSISKRSPRPPSLRLTERDQDLLAALGSHRFLSVPQVVALFFDSTSRAQTRLRQLHQGGLVIQVFVPVRPYDRKSHTVFALSARGARLLSELRGIPRPPHLCDSDRRSGLFLDHTLRRNDVRICLELLDRTLPGFQLLVWKQKPEEVRAGAVVQTGARKRERVPIVPDGFFAFRYLRQLHAFCLETDMGTVRLARMELRYKAYWKWWKEGGARRRFGPLPLRVLTMAPTDRRLDALRKAAMRAPEGGGRGSRLFWFAKLSAADLDGPEALLSPAWQVATPGCNAPEPLIHP